MNPSIVDVNVHPAKLEVKFSDERRVFEVVYYTVKTALEDSEYRPEMTLGAKKSDYNPISAFVPIGADTKGTQIRMPTKEFAPSQDYNSSGASRSAASDGGSGRGSYERSDSVSLSSSLHRTEKPAPSMSARDSMELLARYSKAQPQVDESPLENYPSANADEKKSEPSAVVAPEPSFEYKFVGEAFNCYVLIEYEGALLVIDKHAAHERIIFEDLKRSRNEENRIASQNLLLPITVVLTSDEVAAAKEFTADFESAGFLFEARERSVDITSTPNLIAPSDAEDLFVSMLGEILDGVGNPQNSEDLRREKALYQVACKAAIKGGRAYDRAVIDWLIVKVLALPDITVCPHGRPIAYKLKKSELDRQFDRLK